MEQFDKFIHSVVLYEYYLIFIFMKTLKNEGKSRTNYKSSGGDEVRSILHSYGL